MDCHALRWSRRGVLARLARAVAALAAAASFAPAPAAEAARPIVLASTTSTQDSGFFDHLLPLFTARTGIAVRVVALGTGQALDVARRGDADVVLVHDREAELRFVAEGHGLRRVPVMANDFLVVGPADDPARALGTADVLQALRAVAAARAPFLSRGDRSGTHEAERRLWRAAGVDIATAGSAWHRSVGQGMGAVLNMAAATGAYTLADRASWLAFRNRAGLQVIHEGDARLANPYSVIVVSQARHPAARQVEAVRFADWLVSREGQSAIGAFRIDGRQPYLPNAGTDDR